MKKFLPYFFLAPMMIIMGVLVFFPVAATFTYSLKRWKLTAPGDIAFIGLENYRAILKSPSFWYSMENTLFILAGVLLITMGAGILVTMFLNVETRFSGLMIAIAILPWALPPYVNGILWRFIFSSGYGFLNKLLLQLHLIRQPVEWLSSRWMLLLAVCVVVSWRCIPFTALICLAGRKSLPESIYEAARMDGAGSFHIFRRITLPLMLPFLSIGMTTTSITAVNVFDDIVALSGMGDLGKNVMIESYLTTFSFLDFGKGSAVTYLILFFSSILGFLYIRTMNKEVAYW